MPASSPWVYGHDRRTSVVGSSSPSSGDLAQDVARETTRQVEEMEVLDLGGQPPDLRGERAKERAADAGVVVDEVDRRRGAEDERLDPLDGDGRRGPRRAVEQRELAEEPARSDDTAVVTISRFVADYIQKWTGFESFIHHPPHYGSGPFPQCGRVDNGYVLMMNACAVKGISIFLALARALPDIQFAALPGWGTTHADRTALTRYLM